MSYLKNCDHWIFDINIIALWLLIWQCNCYVKKLHTENIYRWNVWGFLQNNTGKECGGVWGRDETSLVISSWWFTVLLGLLVCISKIFQNKVFFFLSSLRCRHPETTIVSTLTSCIFQIFTQKNILFTIIYYMVHNLWNQHIIQTTLTFASYLTIYLFMSVNADLQYCF